MPPAADAASRSRAQPSDAVEGQLVAMLFTQRWALISGGAAVAAAGAISWLRTGSPWFIWWSGATVLTLAVRLLVDAAYHRSDPARRSAPRWRARFIAGAWLAGAQWGTVALTIGPQHDAFVQLLLVSIETVVIMGASARNASCPLAARGQALLGLAPVFVAALATRDLSYLAFGAFIAFAFVASGELVRFLYRQHLAFLQMNEDNIALLRDVEERNAALAALNDELRQTAATDWLTGIANRRRFNSVLAVEIQRAQRDRTDLSLFIIDVDQFKRYNDLYGHPAGDVVLRTIAGTLARTLHRPADLLARYGGEEFAAILPQCDAAAAVVLAERMRAAIAAAAIPHTASPTGVLSVSIGVATLGASASRLDDVIRRADEALYAAKAAGRDCVRIAGDPLVSHPSSGRRDSTPPEELATS